MSNRVSNRTLMLGIAAVVLLVVAIVIFVFAVTGSAGNRRTPNPAGSGSSVVLTVDQALAAEQGQQLNVEGRILATGDKVELASSLGQSNPPQAVGSTLPLSGVELSKLVGLNTTAGQAGAADVSWSDYSLVLTGTINNGVLAVQQTPHVDEDTSIDGIRLRFSPVSEPVSSGDQVWWAMDITNTGETPLSVVFPNAQRGDLVLSKGETDVYTWSDGRTFAQQQQTVTLQPGKTFPIVLSDTLKVPAGDYDVAATITALVGPQGSESPLPDIVSTLTVH